MSTMIMSACWPLEGMSIAQKAVLISLADNANDQGVCWPSIPTIAKRVCGSERAVQNAIKWLEDAKIVMANRSNGRHTSYTITPAAYSPPQEMHPRRRCTPAGDAPAQEMHPTPAGDAGDPRTACATPPHQVPSNRKEPSEEPSLNRQPARRAPRVALHGELRSRELPDWLPVSAWQDWCEHREAKEGDKLAPWTIGAAKASINCLAKLRDAGHDPAAVIEASVLRGWTGLFPLKSDATAQASGGAPVPSDWWKSAPGIRARGEQLGIDERPNQVFEQFKARVFKAAGPGEWMEDMLSTVNRESPERYAALFAYFNDIPRDSDQGAA
ncbi:helix-turn-helix domain-containing protein [Burkholderia glumae]|uniref:helix-turn-helix domain-containing protein n=1 Tax=Burkholderia glumae TaxID=337 RepID=UPI002037005A|nr:helix-turn-helix domain-containing protein [Burkholderia glumae]MCM2543889.1 helix-turn-helix domain-containing protein [Burkholderia glumae]